MLDHPIRRPLFLWVVLILAASPLLAEAKDQGQTGPAGDLEVETSPVEHGMSYRFHSKVLDEERALNILLPYGYDEEGNETRYPVIYLLDGGANEDYHHVAGLVGFLSTYQLMPPSILVGIGNVDRYRDFSHETKGERYLERVPNAGGSAKFIRFLREEAQPFIEKTFRTSGRRMLIGQSMGGLVASEIFFNSPDLFDQWVIVSPSLWWDDASLIAEAPEALKKTPERKGFLILALGTEGEEMQEGVDRFVAALEAHAPKSLEWHSLPMPEETHATILHRAVYRSLEILYGKTHPGM